MSERTIAADGAEICTEAFGAPSDPAVLLIMGQMASMLWWPEELCERLAGRGRFVIRYDNRDTGRSTAYEPGAPPPYTSDGRPPRRLADIAVPFTVVHGTADPLLPYEHGVALARAVPGATLVTVEGGGHELHERDWDLILSALD